MEHPASTSGSFCSQDGTRIGYTRIGSGPAVVIVHHSLATGANWMAVAKILASDFACYVLDRRGRGSSGDAPNYSIEREYEDVEAALTMAAGTPGKQAGVGASLIGHSFGAVCALGAALKLPPRRMVLYEPPLAAGGTVAGTYLPEYQAAIEAGDRDRAIEIGFTHFASVPPSRVRLMRGTKEWAEARELAHTWTREIDALERHGPSLERYRSLRVPTLLLLGTLSAAHPLRDTTEALAKTLPDAKIVELAGQGHLANERAPELVASRIREFLLT